MSTNVPPYRPAPGFPPPVAGRPKNRQARATSTILNAVRMIGTIGFVGVGAFVFLGSLLAAASSRDETATVAFLAYGVVAASCVLLFAALFYAVVGWFVDTLSLLTQIAENTARQPYQVGGVQSGSMPTPPRWA